MKLVPLPYDGTHHFDGCQVELDMIRGMMGRMFPRGTGISR